MLNLPAASVKEVPIIVGIPVVKSETFAPTIG
jgi:hypothetical protein